MTSDQANQALDLEPKNSFGRAYWMCNTIEMFERLAYFGIRAVVPIYIMQATEPGGLHLTALHKGWIYAWWAILQSWLPMFTGGIADRYGYKRVLLGSILTNIVGYIMMAYTHSYEGFFAGILVLATGTAFFKPALQGTIAQSLTKDNSSLGWGIFYWVVNIGAASAPIVANIVLGKPHSAEGWQNLFLFSAAFTACNLFLLLTFKDVPSGADKSKSLVEVFTATVENIWPYWFVGGRFDPVRYIPGLSIAFGGLALVTWGPLDAYLGDHQWQVGVAMLLFGTGLAVWLRGGTFTLQLRLPAFLLIMSCFWMMMYQLWDLHPNFIEDWVDSSSVVAWLPTDLPVIDGWREYGDRGLERVPQQIILTFYNALLIIILIIPMSWLVRKMRTLSAMLIGMSIATAGVLVAGTASTGWIVILGITCFSFGEMLTGPKKNEYLGLIAPKGKKGLYLGYVNIPIGIGVGLGSIIAGVVYDNYGEKAGLALKELASKPAIVADAARGADWSDAIEKIPALLQIDRGEAMSIVEDEMGVDTTTAQKRLRDVFRYDKGQIANLALLWVAQEQPGASATAALSIKELEEIAQRKRIEALDIVRDEYVNKDKAPSAHQTDSEVIQQLWTRYGDDPDVLNNLALEYLAQATPRVRDAVARMKYDHPVTALHDRIDEIEDKLAIGRTKSFMALSIAMGADDAAIDEALANVDTTGTGPLDRLYTYLINQKHLAFMAVAQKDWSKDTALLRELVRHDPKTLQIIKAEIDKDSLTEKILALVKSIVGSEGYEGETTEEGVNYTRLAGKHHLIIKAFREKTDWSTCPPDLLPPLLQLNPNEARALASAEVAKAPLTTTKLLWDNYHPQYKVWLPFAAIGIFAAIALAIFGQMAKKWKDMNA